MCDFISWIELDGEEYFLTANDLNTKEGRALVKDLNKQGKFNDDISGHGVIRKYWHIPQGKGTNKECSDFSTPDNFPPKIVKQIKKGNFTVICQGSDNWDKVVKQLLSEQALAEYNKITEPAWAEYNKITEQSWAEYNKIKEPAWAEYNKIKEPALAEYKKITEPAWAEYNKIKEPALAEYNKIKEPAWAEYNKITEPAFWKIFMVEKNRSKNWKTKLIKK